MIVGVVLAGGDGQRLGGGGKAWRSLNGLPLLEHVTRCLSPQVSLLALSLHTSASAIGTQEFTAVLTDNAAEASPRQGPLAGIAQALAWAQTVKAQWLAVVPTDTPFLPNTLVQRLKQAADAAQAVAAYPVTQTRHPIPCLLHSSLAESAASHLRQNRLGLGRWLQEVGAVEVAWAEAVVGQTSYDPFFNINHPEDIETAERICTLAQNSPY